MPFKEWHVNKAGKGVKTSKNAIKFRVMHSNEYQYVVNYQHLKNTSHFITNE